jgi:two-component system NtrC family sensor kinase
MRDFIERLLSPHWATELVPNGRLALESALREPPDLVLSDMMMPELDGAALLDALRKNPKTETVPVILISARAGEEARLAGLETGADDYLVKPFAARELLTRVRTQLEMARVRRASAEAARALAETRATLMAALETEHAALREAHTELKRTQAQLVQSAKMASLGQLVAGIAHELNNPLAFALGHLHTIQNNLARLRPETDSASSLDSLRAWERANARAQELRAGLDRIRDLVAHLRTFSRLDEGDLKWVSMSESIDSVLMILRHRLGDGIDVELDLTGPDAVECQPGPLNQAIMNLVSNAIDAIEGPGTIAIRTREHEGWFEFTVEDTGAGIPEAIRDRVFEPFFTTKPVGSGTGLGLAITHSIAEQHGGSVELSPRATGGTRAVFRFPLDRV